LGLGGGGVSDEQDVDVSPEEGFIGEVLAGPSEEHAGDGLFDFHVSEDAGGDGGVYLFVDVGVLAHLLEDLLLLLGVADLGALLDLLKAGHVEVALVELVGFEVVHKHHSRDSDPVAGHAHRHVLAVDHQGVRPRHFSRGDVLGEFLDFQVLGVDDF